MSLSPDLRPEQGGHDTYYHRASALLRRVTPPALLALNAAFHPADVVHAAPSGLMSDGEYPSVVNGSLIFEARRTGQHHRAHAGVEIQALVPRESRLTLAADHIFQADGHGQRQRQRAPRGAKRAPSCEEPMVSLWTGAGRTSHEAKEAVRLVGESSAIVATEVSRVISAGVWDAPMVEEDRRGFLKQAGDIERRLRRMTSLSPDTQQALLREAVDFIQGLPENLVSSSGVVSGEAREVLQDFTDKHPWAADILTGAGISAAAIGMLAMVPRKKRVPFLLAMATLAACSGPPVASSPEAASTPTVEPSVSESIYSDGSGLKALTYFESLGAGIGPGCDYLPKCVTPNIPIENTSGIATPYDAYRILALSDAAGQPIHAFMLHEASGRVQTDLVLWVLDPEQSQQGASTYLRGYRIDIVIQPDGHRVLRLREQNGEYVTFGTIVVDKETGLAIMTFTLPDGTIQEYENPIGGLGEAILNLDPELRQAAAAPEEPTETLASATPPPTETPTPAPTEVSKLEIYYVQYGEGSMVWPPGFEGKTPRETVLGAYFARAVGFVASGVYTDQDDNGVTRYYVDVAFPKDTLTTTSVDRSNLVFYRVFFGSDINHPANVAGVYYIRNHQITSTDPMKEVSIDDLANLLDQSLGEEVKLEVWMTVNPDKLRAVVGDELPGQLYAGLLSYEHVEEVQQAMQALEAKSPIESDATFVISQLWIPKK